MAVVTVIHLSDGEPCDVKRLGIFELDGVGPTLVGPFTYTFTLANGQEVEDTYPLERITRPPEHPGVPESEIVEGTPSWHALLDYQTYKMAVAHERPRLKSMIDYVYEVSAYVASAVSDEDRDRIVTDEDWLKVREAALVPGITPEILADAFRRHFGAHFQGKDIFDALSGMAPGSGGYDAVRVWEINTMTQHGFTEEQWAGLSLAERSRKVAAANLPKLVEALETDLKIKEMKTKNAVAT